MKKVIKGLAYFLAAAIFMGLPGRAEATSPTQAELSTCSIYVDGAPIQVAAYLINRNNFFKLRDLAFALSDTEKKFNVVWNGAANAVELVTGQAYTPVGGELTPDGANTAIATPGTARVLRDGKEIAVTGYVIKGSHYYKLRDLGDALGLTVDWVAETNRVDISSTKYLPVPDGQVPLEARGLVTDSPVCVEYSGPGVKLDKRYWPYSDEVVDVPDEVVTVTVSGWIYSSVNSNSAPCSAAVVQVRTYDGFKDWTGKQSNDKTHSVVSAGEILDTTVTNEHGYYTVRFAINARKMAAAVAAVDSGAAWSSLFQLIATWTDKDGTKYTNATVPNEYGFSQGTSFVVRPDTRVGEWSYELNGTNVYCNADDNNAVWTYDLGYTIQEEPSHITPYDPHDRYQVTVNLKGRVVYGEKTGSMQVGDYSVWLFAPAKNCTVKINSYRHYPYSSVLSTVTTDNDGYFSVEVTLDRSTLEGALEQRACAFSITGSYTDENGVTWENRETSARVQPTPETKKADATWVDELRDGDTVYLSPFPTEPEFIKNGGYTVTFYQKAE